MRGFETRDVESPDGAVPHSSVLKLYCRQNYTAEVYYSFYPMVSQN